MKALCVQRNASTKINAKKFLVIKLMVIVTSAQKVLHGTAKSARPFVKQINCGTETHVLASRMPSESKPHASYADPIPLLIKTKKNAFVMLVSCGALGLQVASVLPVQSIHSQR